jgi:hypothetical protein
MLPPVSKQGNSGSFSPMTTMPKGSTWRPPVVAMAELSSGGIPPVTITGVAPWAFQSAPSETSSKSQKDRIPLSTARPNRLPRGESTPSHHQAASLPLNPSTNSEDSHSNGLEIVLNYMEQCRVNGQGGAPDDDGKGTFWAREQAALKPTLLPDLKFHDLVFGQ